MKSISVITSSRLRDTPDSGTSGPGAAVPPPWARCPGLAALSLGRVVGTTPGEGHLARGQGCRSVSASPRSYRPGDCWRGWSGVRPWVARRTVGDEREEGDRDGCGEDGGR